MPLTHAETPCSNHHYGHNGIMKSLGKPRYTQEQYEAASAWYTRYCRDAALAEGRPAPTWPARLPLARPDYGRWFAGVCKAVSMHLGIPVWLLRVGCLLSMYVFGAGAIVYLFLWITVPAADPVTQAYLLAGERSVGQAPLALGNVPYAMGVPHGQPNIQTGSDHREWRNHTDTPYVQPNAESYTQPNVQSAGISPANAETSAQSSASVPSSVPLNAPSVELPTNDIAWENARIGDEPKTVSGENLEQVLRNAPKPTLIALSGLAALIISAAMLAGGITMQLVLPLLLAVIGVGVSWLRFNAAEGQLWTMIGGMALVFVAYALFLASYVRDFANLSRLVIAGLVLLLGIALTIVPWILAIIRDLGTERASKEREEERADMTAHLHDGVLQTLALIQLHAGDQQTVFSLARSQERELREWLYQEHTTSDRSVSAGLKEIAAHIEDAHGKPIEVVTVGDARPSAQTDALLDATQQALVNAVTHGGEPISVYCEAGAELIEIFVRDHGEGFDVNAVPANRLGIRESIVGRIRRRGGTVEIVSRPQWGTEVRMHMPIAAMPQRGTDGNVRRHSQTMQGGQGQQNNQDGRQTKEQQ